MSETEPDAASLDASAVAWAIALDSQIERWSDAATKRQLLRSDCTTTDDVRLPQVAPSTPPKAKPKARSKLHPRVTPTIDGEIASRTGQPRQSISVTVGVSEPKVVPDDHSEVPKRSITWTWIERIAFVCAILGLGVAILTRQDSVASTATARDERREKEESLERDRMPDPLENYVLLPRPVDLDKFRFEVGEGVERVVVNDLYGSNYLIDGSTEGFTSTPMLPQDLVLGSTVDCDTSVCEQAVRDHEFRSKVIYLEIRNVGINRAEDVTLEFERFEPGNGEVNSFQSVFPATTGKDTEWIQLGSLLKKQTLLVPLVPIAVFAEADPGASFVGFGEARLPRRICWTDGGTKRRFCKQPRAPYDSMVYVGSGMVLRGG